MTAHSYYDYDITLTYIQKKNNCSIEFLTALLLPQFLLIDFAGKL